MMKDLINKRVELTEEIRKLELEKQEVEVKVVRQIIDDNNIELLNVKWARLKRYY